METKYSILKYKIGTVTIANVIRIPSGLVFDLCDKLCAFARSRDLLPVYTPTHTMDPCLLSFKTASVRDPSKPGIRFK